MKLSSFLGLILLCWSCSSNTEENSFQITSWEITSIDSTEYDIYDDKIFIIVEGIDSPKSSVVTKLKKNDLTLYVNDTLYEKSSIYIDFLRQQKYVPLKLVESRVENKKFMFKYHVEFGHRTANDASQLYEMYSGHIAANISIVSIHNNLEITKAPELGLRIFVNDQEMSLDSVQEMYYSPL